VTYFTVTGPNEDIAEFHSWCAAECAALGYDWEVLRSGVGECLFEATSKTFVPAELANKIPGRFPALVIDIVGCYENCSMCFEGRIKHGKCRYKKVIGFIKKDKEEAFFNKRVYPFVKDRFWVIPDALDEVSVEVEQRH
jgi:hypothetical protein